MGGEGGDTSGRGGEEESDVTGGQEALERGCRERKTTVDHLSRLPGKSCMWGCVKCLGR